MLAADAAPSATNGQDDLGSAPDVDASADATLTSATTAPPSPAPAAKPTSVPQPSGFDPRNYVGQGDAYNCGDFKSQADAQAVLRAEPGDPNKLDADRDGIACESNPAPKDLNRVPR